MKRRKKITRPKRHAKIQSQKSPRSRKKLSLRRKPQRKTPRRPKILERLQLKSIQQEISHAKFFTGFGPMEETPQYITSELPDGYQEDKIIGQVRDPWWIHTYWEIRPSTIDTLKNRLAENFQDSKSILRVYDISFIDFNGTNAHWYFDIEIRLDARNWYIDVATAGRSWCVDIGFRLRDGSFIMVARSNCVTTPLDGPSGITDEEWMIPDDKFARLYGMGLGFGPSSPLKKAKGYIGSPGLFSVSSPIRKQKAERQRDFWFSVDTELIVRGATEPDARVTVRGQPVKLNADGTFSLHFSLPEGKQTVPVEVRSYDGLEYKTVTPIVSKETRQGIF